MNILATATSLSNDELLARLPALAADERHTSVELVAHLAALEARPSLYASIGFGSLFAYCTTVLRLSEDAACTRIAVAGACRRFPAILELIATGATNLTNIRRLAGKLTPENHETVLARAAHKTRDEVEKLLRELDPLPDVRSSVRKAPTPPAPPAKPATPRTRQGGLDLSADDSAPAPSRPAPRPTVRPTAPARYHVHLTIGEATRTKLRHAQALLRREIRDGDLEPIFDRALDLLVADLERTRLGMVKRPRAGRVIRSGTDEPEAPSRHIALAVRRAVVARDENQCAYAAPDGRRCTERAYLEFHHIHPYAHGGPATADNISLRCRRHNQYEAELVYGPHDTSQLGEGRETYGGAA